MHVITWATSQSAARNIQTQRQQQHNAKRNDKMPAFRELLHVCGNREEVNFNGTNITFQFRNTLKSQENLDWKKEIILVRQTEPHRSPRDKSNKLSPQQRNKQPRVQFQRAAVFPSTWAFASTLSAVFKPDSLLCVVSPRCDCRHGATARWNSCTVW